MAGSSNEMPSTGKRFSFLNLSMRQASRGLELVLSKSVPDDLLSSLVQCRTTHCNALESQKEYDD
jgi:hypothetical protein